MTQTAKGLRQFAVARQQTQVEQVIARQAWRVEPRSRATLRHSQRAAGQQLESEETVARVAWRPVAPRRSRAKLWHSRPAAMHLLELAKRIARPAWSFVARRGLRVGTHWA